MLPETVTWPHFMGLGAAGAPAELGVDFAGAAGEAALGCWARAQAAREAAAKACTRCLAIEEVLLNNVSLAGGQGPGIGVNR